MFDLHQTISTDLQRVLMMNVLFEPIAVVMFSLLPQVVISSGMSLELGLNVSLVTFALVHLYLSYWVFSRFCPHLGIEMPKALTLVLISLAVVLCLVQLVSVAVALPVPTEFLYLIGLYWPLSMCFLNFVMLFVLNQMTPDKNDSAGVMQHMKSDTYIGDWDLIPELCIHEQGETLSHWYGSKVYWRRLDTR